MMNKTTLLVGMLFCIVLSQHTFAIDRPNVVLVFIDDMGWGDLSCFGNTEASTPHIDAMAAEGIRFEQFYVNSPICSPSRVAISTGQYPQRHRITSFLNNRNSNQQRGVANWLSPDAPMLARSLQKAGYATAHCGKWHMGGQRDVDDAPPISEYGFDTSLTNFEGMGAKLLPLTETPTNDGGVKDGRIWEGAERLGEPVTWMLRSKITGGFTDKAIAFIDQAQAADKPFYVNVWPDDVHSPFFPSIEGWKEGKRGLYLSVLEEMDAQLGRLFKRIQNDEKLRDNTMILICSDNGPEPGAGSAGPFKGNKATLYEGGVRSPLIVWAPGWMAKNVQGTANEKSVFSAIDLASSLLELTGAEVPAGVELDGEDLASVLIGKSDDSRKQPLFFRRPPEHNKNFQFKNLPDLAVRDGQWKLLCDYDSSHKKLYNVVTDPGEETNVATGHPEIVSRLVTELLGWNSNLPADAGDPNYSPGQ